ncbi:MAG: ribosome maturation factor RimM [Lactobacillaceae bacterium]|jgi:16S rRNA processing protein RimM|nr:ribosome maturation factor RimM [Lactobacillaceae bacterium]
MKKDNRICLGKIVGALGIKGEVKILSFTEYGEDIGNFGELEDKTGTVKFNLEVNGGSKGTIRAVIKGVADRNAAEALVGTELYVSKDLLPKLDEDEFYHDDLIGLAVKLQKDNSEIGTVSGLYNFGAGDIIEIKLKNSSKTEMIPFTESYVPEINIKDGYIIVETVLLPFVKEIREDGSEG